jgi:hypothetical protein
VLATLVAVMQTVAGSSSLARAEWEIAPAIAEAPAMAPPPARVAVVQAGSHAPHGAATGASGGSLIAVTPRHASSSSALAGVAEHHERPLGEPAAFPFYPTGPPRIS